MFRNRRALFAVAALAIALPAAAHHSTAMFKWGEETPLTNATVERWDWTNPHTFLYVRVPNKAGGTDLWAFEGMSPNHLSRNGWTKRTVNPGDKISLTYYPLKDGRKGGFNVSITFANGKTIRQLPKFAPPTAPQQQ
ncbi:MAG: DUF6152 family protein [Sphingomonadales bacterium]